MAERRALVWRPIDGASVPTTEQAPFARGLLQGSAADVFVLGRLGAAGIRRPAAAATISPLAASIRKVGIPAVAGTPTEEALRLLEAAAEIEHALLVQYLYAAFSCASPSEVRDAIATVAKQEMGHLVTVQNLRLLCGGTPYVARQDQDPQTDKDPFPWKLEPLSLDSLAKYILCEMPDDQHVPSGMVATVAEARQRAAGAVGSAVHRVGVLYAKIYWLFMVDDEDVGPWTDFPASVFASMPEERGRHISSFGGDAAGILQADSAEWLVGGDIFVDTCGDRTAAQSALYRITSQGEGLSAFADSHFATFVRMYELFKAGGVNVFDVAVDPTTDHSSSGTRITHPLSAACCNLADAQYRVLMVEILLSLAIAKGGPQAGSRQELIVNSIASMKDVKWLSIQLASRLPRDAGGIIGAPGPKTGATMSGPPTITGAYAELLDAFTQALANLETHIEGVAAVAEIDALVRNKLASWRAGVAKRRDLDARLRAIS